ncbi:hypothetical protein BS50DRAFT_576802 [Corynespora cassiicola Philippines]|uniref:GCN5-related N-acetyltransferase Rv2170-like domain-containing protein n=1 Tax=Corynespora cassiicola Philippines TaxID=1448308 RepID=A0A2T2NC43_CORCC|nr:hypothetical protein BS50DRAFT_576802 [Corynespora cassiicola Philippines]
MPPAVYEHSATSPLLQHAFAQSLPYSINLVYRTQHANRTPDAHILATFPEDAQQVPHCWVAAYFDRSMRPETELWLFASGEMPGHNSASLSGHDAFCGTCKRRVLDLIDHLPTISVPPLHPTYEPLLELAKLHEQEHPETGPGIKYHASASTYMRHLLMPTVVTLGACHEQLVAICAENGLIRQEFPGPDARLNKFLFKIADLPQTRVLPDGLRWGQVRDQDIALVQSRTQIPRSKRTLLTLKSVGVFDERCDMLVGWAFLGLDGSLTALHTEPEQRGKGLAKAMASKIIREHAPGLAVDAQGDAWSHADVYIGNVQSEAVCKSLGGKPMWQIYWVRIDVGRAGALGWTR